jgi:hypothetical protein
MLHGRHVWLCLMPWTVCTDNSSASREGLTLGEWGVYAPDIWGSVEAEG